MKRRRKWLKAKVFYNHTRSNSKKTEQEASLKGPQFIKQKRNSCPKTNDTGKPNTTVRKTVEMPLIMLL